MLIATNTCIVKTKINQMSIAHSLRLTRRIADGKHSAQPMTRRYAGPRVPMNRASSRAGCRANRNEFLRHQRSTADEPAVYIRHGEQFLRIGGLDAAAI